MSPDELMLLMQIGSVLAGLVLGIIRRSRELEDVSTPRYVRDAWRRWIVERLRGKDGGDPG